MPIHLFNFSAWVNFADNLLWTQLIDFLFVLFTCMLCATFLDLYNTILLLNSLLEYRIHLFHLLWSRFLLLASLKTIIHTFFFSQKQIRLFSFPLLISLCLHFFIYFRHGTNQHETQSKHKGLIWFNISWDWPRINFYGRIKPLSLARLAFTYLSKKLFKSSFWGFTEFPVKNE